MMNFESKLTLKWKVYLEHRCIRADFVLMIFLFESEKKYPFRNIQNCIYRRYISYIV